MAVLAYADNSGGKIPKSALEALFYAGKTAQALGTEAVALVIGSCDKEALAMLGRYGVKKVLHAGDERLNRFDPVAYTKVIAAAADKAGAGTLVFAHNYVSKSVSPRLAVRLKAGLAVCVVGYPQVNGEEFTLKRTLYAGKAFASVTLKSHRKIIAVQPNCFPPEPVEGPSAMLRAGAAVVEPFQVELAKNDFGVSVKAVNKVTDKVPLTEASIVVSGGRGMKGGENWPMLEELADALGAALSCSKPVADMHWRPHSEHVGQTGITVRPNLYVAVGISGAIQHLAGVNGSKYIVAINKDPEAPIFKAADYGIAGDAFKIVPELTKAVRKLKE